LLQAYTQQIEPGDITNREGHAAKVYFNALFGMGFSRSLENTINSALNYGYGILLSVFAREIASNGYCTQLGIFHDNMFNQFNLASDFMEPFRPFVDRVVCKMNLEVFGHDEKVEIIQVLNEQVVIDGKQQYMVNAIRVYCKSVFDALEEKDISKIRFPNYEL
jgi:CRISPR-associated endonuclease Cas1 subtype II